MDFERIKLEVYSILRRLNLLESRGGIKSLDTDTTISSTDPYTTFFVSCPSGNVLLVIPNAENIKGVPYTFKKTDNVNVVNIQPVESQTIDGNLTYTLTNQYDSITFVSDGSTFYITSTIP